LFRVLELSLANDLDETPFDHVGWVMQRQFFHVIASASEAIQLLEREAGLLRRGACHRARVRATRWLCARHGH
jgi:hypothetical protein